MKKLKLSKKVISRLTQLEMDQFKGGTGPYTTIPQTDTCTCPPAGGSGYDCEDEGPAGGGSQLIFAGCLSVNNLC